MHYIELFYFLVPLGLERLLLQNISSVGFSVSACTRPKRPHEIHGEDYYFLSVQEFKQKITQGAFIEWEEEYAGSYYGTFKNEVENIWAAKKIALFDMDVQGGLRLKSFFKEKALAVYVGAPSLHVLIDRLRRRATELEESIILRMNRMLEEASLAPKFDEILINEELQQSLIDAQ